MNGFRREPGELRRRELEAVERVLHSGWYILGSEIKAFEAEWARATGAAHAVGVGNGMDAIEIGLRALGIGPGDEVITTPMTAFATVLAVMRAGATPVLADIDPRTAQMSVDSAQRCFASATRAVLLVHLYGHLHDMERWKALCAERAIHLVEDSAQAHLARWRGTASGAWGAVGAFSFYPTKNLGAIGDGGALVTGDAELAAKARRLRNYGQSERYYHPELGLNSRLDELQAAILRVRLSVLDEYTARRREIARRYRAGIANPAIELLAAPVEEANHVYHLFVVRCGERDRLAEHLAHRGIESLIHYPVPIHQQAPCRSLRRDPQGLAAAEQHARSCLSIPCHPQLADDEVASVIQALNDFR
jgi:dTDP-4-amino-4,6-dideoxygalactose transaminase